MKEEEKFDKKKVHPTVWLIKEAIGKAQLALSAFIKECSHHLVRDGESVCCQICGEDYGWWCPKSPDHKCHYSVDEDACDFCGEPSERK